MKLIDLPTLEGQQRALPRLNPCSFVFLRSVNRIRVQADRLEWRWEIASPPASEDWTLVEVRQSAPALSERFLVARGHVPSDIQGGSVQRFAVAIRLGAGEQGTLPAKLEAKWHWIRLTFETEDEFPLDFVVNGDFETDSGRLGIRNSAKNEALLAACLRTVGELCQEQLIKHSDFDAWLAWADVLHLRDGESKLRDRFDSHHARLVREFQTVADFLCGHLPAVDDARAASSFTYPSGLVRKLEHWVRNWGFRTEDWIDARVQERLPRTVRDTQDTFRLNDVIAGIPAGAPILSRIARDFQTPAFQAAVGALDAIAEPELARARKILEEKLRPPSITDWAIKQPIEPWTPTQLWSWWKNEGEPEEQYRLIGGDNWPLLFPADVTPEGDRATRLRECLAQPGNDKGRCVWYRLLAFACLLSARGRTETLRKFWKIRLEAGGFWEATTMKCEFATATRELFGSLVLRAYRDDAASGEWADYWRHVFYDVRKVHELVWHHDFAETIVQLALDAQHAAELPLFLRSGQLPGQRAWAGVLGQSSGAPLFFVSRELCRLGIAASPDLKRLAFFPCTPVRRAAVSIGWIEPSLADATDFDSLAKVSDKLYERTACHPELLELLDIPLLHMGLTSDRLPPPLPSV
jgi:hypothetical protein